MSGINLSRIFVYSNFGQTRSRSEAFQATLSNVEELHRLSADIKRAAFFTKKQLSTAIRRMPQMEGVE